MTQSFAQYLLLRTFPFNDNSLIDEDELSYDFDEDVNTMKRQYECITYIQTTPDPKRQNTMVDLKYDSKNTDLSTPGHRNTCNEQPPSHVDQQEHKLFQEIQCNPITTTLQNRFSSPPKYITQTFHCSAHSEKIKYNQQWNRRYNELLEFQKQNGHCNVPKRYKPNKPLGFWVCHQRDKYKMMREEGKTNTKMSPMTRERIKLLDAIGFEWNPLLDQWHQRYQQLLEYKKLNGHCNVPKCYKNNTKLAKWVTNQRTQFKHLCEGNKSQMTPARLDKLNAIGFQWSFHRKSHMSKLG